MKASVWMGHKIVAQDDSGTLINPDGKLYTECKAFSLIFSVVVIDDFLNISCKFPGDLCFR